MGTDAEKFLCLLEEIETSHKLIKAGFGSLQEIDMANEFYHLPHQLLASGLERLMKCYISVVYEDRNGSYPDMDYMKALGHDLDVLCNKICTEFYGGMNRPLVRQEHGFTSTDTTLRECVRILSLFGKFGRYYNIDVVAGSPHSPIDPKSEWETLESQTEDITPYLSDSELLHRDYYPRVHAKLISKLERFVRAIALQFTIGDHADQFGRLSQLSSVFTDFRNLQNEQLGTNDYRQSVRILNQRKEKWVKRWRWRLLHPKWPARAISKQEFGDAWPFRSDRVIVELRESLICIIFIEGYTFALNGAAKSRFHLPDPHEAGVAILGKSIGPFINLAQSLMKQTQ